MLSILLSVFLVISLLPLIGVNASAIDEETRCVDEFGVVFDEEYETLILYVPGEATSYTITENVEHIEEDAFGECAGLVSIDVDEDNEHFSCDEYGVLFNKDKTILIRCPEDAPFSTYIIPDSVIEIGEGAFEDCDNLTSITIGNKITTIGNGAFEDSEYLETVIIEDSVIHIGESAFEDCQSLSNLKLGENVDIIDNYAFYDCPTLTEIVIPDSVTIIGEGAFEDNFTLATVFMGSGVKLIGDSAFEDCDLLSNLTIGNNVKAMGNYAFYDCASLVDVVIPDSVTSIGEGVFEDNFSLKIVIIGKGVTSIGASAFEDCDSLVNVKIGENVKKIDKYAFYDCFRLPHISIPESVTTIGDNAFGDCYSLKSLSVTPEINSVSPLAFAGTNGITDIYYAGTYHQWATAPSSLINLASMLNSTIYYNCNRTEYTFGIKNQSVLLINYKDGIILHSDFNGTIPEGAAVEWTANNGKFRMTDNEDGTCTVISKSSGVTEFTATLVDKDGDILATDTVKLTSNASFTQKIIAFFRSLFGTTKIYDN